MTHTHKWYIDSEKNVYTDVEVEKRYCACGVSEPLTPPYDETGREYAGPCPTTKENAGWEDQWMQNPYSIPNGVLVCTACNSLEFCCRRCSIGFIRTLITRVVAQERAKALEEAAAILHKHIMATNKQEAVYLGEKAQEEILALIKQ